MSFDDLNYCIIPLIKGLTVYNFGMIFLLLLEMWRYSSVFHCNKIAVLFTVFYALFYTAGEVHWLITEKGQLVGNLSDFYWYFTECLGITAFYFWIRSSINCMINRVRVAKKYNGGIL